MARSALAAAAAALRSHALAKPHATEHFPWGETAIKVNGKVFLFMHVDGTSLGLSTKLPTNHAVALMLPFAEPTGYGLGKAGWVSARFAASDAPPTELLCDWIDESYLAVAPARFARLADGSAIATKSSAKAGAKKRARAKQPSATKPTAAAKKLARAKPSSAKKSATGTKKRAHAKPSSAKKPARAARAAKR